MSIESSATEKKDRRAESFLAVVNGWMINDCRSKASTVATVAVRQ